MLIVLNKDKSYTINFDSKGGSEISTIEVKDGEIVKLPKSPKKDGYTFVAWINKEGQALNNGYKVSKDLTLEAKWRDNNKETVVTKLKATDKNEEQGLIIEKDSKILLPVTPIKEGYIFICWIDEEGNYIDEWFCDGVEYDYSGFDSQEFPRYTTATEKFFVIKYNGEIIVDRKMGL